MKYLLPCSQCGKQHEVQQTQAGEKLSCPCGNILEVPSFRGFRELKPVGAGPSPRAASRTAGDLPRRLVVVAALLLIAIGLLVSVYGGLLRTGIYVPERQSSVDPEIDSRIDDLNPSETLELWTAFRDEGLGPYQVPYRFMAEWTKGYYTGMLQVGLGMIGAGIVLLGVAICWPSRRKPAQAVILAVVLSGTVLSADAADVSPNIVIFLVDDMGVMDTSVPFLTDAQARPKRYPLNDFYRTPNMERLAARGIRFNDFAAMSVCSPTRLSIMTGQNAARHRTTNWINPDRDNAGPQGAPQWNWQGLKRGDVTLARLLQAAGYRTIHVGKGHFGPRDSEGADPSNLGFDVNVGGASIGAPGSYYGQENYGHGTKRAASAVPHLEKYHGTETHLTEACTLESNAHVREAVKDGKPFFLYLAHYAVHAPFQSDPRFAAHYADSGKPTPAQAFATLIEGMDKSLGDVLDQIEALGVADNTLLFFLGDNGSDAPLGHQHEVACAEPLRGKKGAHYEGGTRTPLIAAWVRHNPNHPNQQRLPIARDAIQSQLANVCDLFPTILALAGIETPPDHAVDGQRLDTLLTGRPDDTRQVAFLMHYPHAPHRSEYFTVYREGPWKVIYHYVPSEVSSHRHYQLFHLGEDPFEQRDLAVSHPEELCRMMQGLIAALDRHHAVYPVAQDGATPLRPKLP